MSSKDKAVPPADDETGKSDLPKKPARTIELEAEEVAVDEETLSAESAESDDDPGEETADDAESPLDGDGKPPPPPQRTKPTDVRSFVTHLAAGLVGGLAGVVGAGIGLGTLPLSGITSGGAPVATTVQIEERLDEITTAVSEQGKKISTLPGSAPLEEVKARLAAIEAKPATQTGVPPEIGERLAKLEKTLKTLEQAGGTSGASEAEQAAALVARVDGVETALEKRYAALEDQIARTKSEISEAAPDSADIVAGKAEIAVISERIKDLEQKVTAIANRPAAAPVTTGGKAAGLALAFQALRRAADNGTAFKPQLDSLKSLAGDGVDLAALTSVASKGVATQTSLLSDLPGALKSARSAASRSKDSTLLERLASNAQSVVRVRKIGPIDGNGTGAVLSRMEDAARNGNLKMAVDEAGQLDGAAAESVKSWLEQARARIALDIALLKLETGLLANLGAPRAEKE